jgi:cytochrome c-type biogenesis protein CcmH/NrfG
MTDSNEIEQLLTELRDLQREHLAEYRRVTEQSLELQRRAVERQEQAVRFSVRVVLLIGASVFCLAALLVYLRMESL